MPSLKDLRNRISSVKATQKITKAMQMVAAAKLRRAQLAAEAARPYAERMEKVLARLKSGLGAGSNAPALLTGSGSDQTHLLVVCSAERGLCGGFNASIARLARDKANALLREGKSVKIICVGKKANDILRRQFGDKVIELIELRGVKSLTYSVAEPIGAKIIEMFHRGEFDVATLFFSKFQSVILQVPTALQLIPLQIPAGSDAEVSSGAAYEGNGGHTGYAATKAGIVGMTLPASRSLTPHGIRVNTIVAGGFDTPILDFATPESLAEIVKDGIHYRSVDYKDNENQIRLRMELYLLKPKGDYIYPPVLPPPKLRKALGLITKSCK